MTSDLLPLSAAQAALIAGMHRVCFAEPWDAPAMAALLAMPGAFGWLDASPQPRAFVLARHVADEAEILTLLVLPPYRRQGLAQALLDAAAHQARHLGAVRLFLEVAGNNQPALELYRKAGFQQVGLRPRYYGGVTDALLMVRRL